MRKKAAGEYLPPSSPRRRNEAADCLVCARSVARNVHHRPNTNDGDSPMYALLHSARDYSNHESWRRLVSLCEPLLYGWLRRQALQDADADDLVQETLATLVLKVPTFQFNENSEAFRCWLRKTLVNRLLNFRRAKRIRSICRPSSELLDRIADAVVDSRNELMCQWNNDHDRQVARQAMERIKPEFQAKTWHAFHRVTLEEADPQRVAIELDVSLSSVYVAKFRVLKRLRQEAKKSSV